MRLVGPQRLHNGKKFNLKYHRPTEAVIPVFIMGCPLITKWGDYSTFNICDNGMPRYENGNRSREGLLVPKKLTQKHDFFNQLISSCT